MASVSDKVEYQVTLLDYGTKTIMETSVFDVVVKNPCNDGNKIMFKDQTR